MQDTPSWNLTQGEGGEIRNSGRPAGSRSHPSVPRPNLMHLRGKDSVEKKTRCHFGRAKKRQRFGWNKESRKWLYKPVGLFNGYLVK